MKFLGNTNLMPLLSPFFFLFIFTHGANSRTISFSSDFHSLEADSLGLSSSGRICFLKCFKMLFEIDFVSSITGRLQANLKIKLGQLKKNNVYSKKESGLFFEINRVVCQTFSDFWNCHPDRLFF